MDPDSMMDYAELERDRQREEESEERARAIRAERDALQFKRERDAARGHYETALAELAEAHIRIEDQRRQIVALREALGECIADPWDNDRRDAGRRTIEDTKAAAAAYDAAAQRATLGEVMAALWDTLPKDSSGAVDGLAPETEAIVRGQDAIKALLKKGAGNGQ